MKRNECRERKTGRYHFGLASKCVCGHTRGQHTAVAPHMCINHEVGDSSEICVCERFRPAKRK